MVPSGLDGLPARVLLYGKGECLQRSRPLGLASHKATTTGAADSANSAAYSTACSANTAASQSARVEIRHASEHNLR